MMKSAPVLTADSYRDSDSAAVLLLAGGLRMSELHETLRIPALCLPLRSDWVLLDAWLHVVRTIPNARRIRIVVNHECDATAITRVLEQRSATLLDLDIKTIVDPDPWRGPAGLVRDVAQRLGADTVIAAEASCMPPTDLSELFNRLMPDSSGLSISGHACEPAGVFVLTWEAIKHIPNIGYYDIKEQLLPTLYNRGNPLGAVETGQEVHRLRHREGYLRAIAATRRNGVAGAPVAHSSRIDPDAKIVGTCLIENNVIIEPGAVVHDSVILAHSIIERNAVVSQSVVGVGGHVGAKRILRRSIVAGRTNHRHRRWFNHVNRSLVRGDVPA